MRARAPVHCPRPPLVIDLGRAPEEAKTTLPPDPMKYVEWVQRVLQATKELTRADSQARLVGVPWDQVLGRLGGPSDASSPAFHQSPSSRRWLMRSRTRTGSGWSSPEASGRYRCA